TIMNANDNTVRVTGSSNQVTITGTVAGAPAQDNRVIILGSNDTVTITDMSNRTVVIRGNNLTCTGAPPPGC
ncbi:MAG TPA: hypothetical protein VGL20_00935, partial [Candidatus Dormibacteraeota bacterium]